MANDLIRVVDIEKGFGGVQVLKKASLTIGPGEIRCLAGENGCGKSTLIKVISGVYAHDGGTVELNGRKYDRLEPIDSIREGIQVIYQDFSLFPNLTVAENLAINHQVERRKNIVSWRDMRETVKKCLAQIDVDIPLNKTVEQLTVADKQLVAISRALLNDAKVIIMDEPTTALTQKEVDALFVIIRRLKERDISTLFVSHKMREMLEVSEKITIMRNGQVVADGPIRDFDEASITRHMTGRDLEGFEMEVIAAVVLGGASLTGGRGTVLGTILGVVILVLIKSSLILVGIPSDWQKVAVGLVLIIATVITAIRSRRD